MLTTRKRDMANFENYSRLCYATRLPQTRCTDGLPSIPPEPVQNRGAATPHSPLRAPVARNGAWRVRDGWRGLLQLPPHLPPQPPKISPSGWCTPPHLYTRYPFSGPLLSIPQGWRAVPPATAPPSPARAAPRTIETFRRLLIDSKINAVGKYSAAVGERAGLPLAGSAVAPPRRAERG